MPLRFPASAPLLAALAALATLPLGAQEVRGTLTLADGVTPASGVIVVAERPSTSATLGRTSTGGRGEFVLRVPSGTLRLRALRIGHRPTDLGTYTLADGERRALTLRLEDQPVVIAAVTTRAASQCQVPARAGVAVASLFEEARKALTLTQLSPPEGRPVARVLISTSRTDPQGAPLGDARRELRTGASSRPFQSLPPALIARVGYVTEEPDGTVYRAPDAAVLLSNEFAAQHCLQVVDGSGDETHLVGLAFRPVQRTRDVIRIAGTLWIDRATFELQRLEYRYVGLPPALERAGLGGTVAFTRLTDGLWFEDRWEIRMPRTSIRQRTELTGSGAATAQITVLDAIQVSAGEVLSMRRGDAVAYVGDAALEDSLMRTDAAMPPGIDRGVAAPPRSTTAQCDDDVDTGEATAMLYGTVYEQPPEPSAGASVAAEWKERFSVTGPHEWRWMNRRIESTTADDGFYSLCGAPRARLVTLRATQGVRRTGVVGVRVPWSADRARADLRFATASPRGLSSRASVVQVRTTDDLPVPFAVVTAGDGTTRVADHEGRALLSAVDGDALRLLVRRIGFGAHEGTVPRDADSGNFIVTLSPLATGLRAVEITAVRDDALVRSGFYDRLERAQRGAFVAEFITPEDVRDRSAARASQLLAGRRFAQLGASRESRPRTIVLGRNGCAMTLLIDGQRVTLDRTPEGGVPIDELVDGRAVRAIEIYASTANAPAELIPLTGGGSCGIVAIWTGAP